MPSISFKAEADPSELPEMIGYATRMVGFDVWTRRVEALRSELKNNPLWKNFLLERYGLEMAFGDIHRHVRSTGRLPWPPRTAEQYRFYSFVATLSRVHGALSKVGQKKLSGALRSGLEKDFGLGPLAFEMKIVAHLMARGFGIEFHDLEGAGGYDFLATRESLEVEVECKHVSGDVGRQIPLRDLYGLGGVLQPAITRAVKVGDGGRFIRVTLPERLTSNKEHQDKIAGRINAVLSGDAIAIDDEVCTISERPFSLSSSPFFDRPNQNPTMDDIRGYLKREFDIGNANVLLNWCKGQAAVAIWLNSNKRDKVSQSIFRRMKDDARGQFSGSRPAFLCVHFADLTDEQLLRLAEAERSGTPTAFQRMASALLQKFAYLHTIAMMTDGEVRISSEIISDGNARTSIQEVGPSYIFKNSDHTHTGDIFLDRAFT